MDDLEALTRARAEFGRRLAVTTDDQWTDPSPCEDWSVGTVIDHVVRGQRMATQCLQGASRDETRAGMHEPVLAERTSAGAEEAFRQWSDAFETLIAEPGAMQRMVAHPRMDMPGAQLLAFRVSDLLVHAWDVARGTGQDETLDPELVAAVWSNLGPMAPGLAATGMFGEGPSPELPEDASLQHRLLDATGRRP